LSPFRKYLPLLTLVFAISAFYLYYLDGVGVLGPDEPRYAAIGIAMRQTGDLVTPRLWGSPWFEKPPLLYWMTAAGSLFGLRPELAGRLPVALLSLIFLGVSFRMLSREFGRCAAAVAVLTLATCAGWLAYSELCLTDVPLAVFFSLAVFSALPLLRPEPDVDVIGRRFAVIGLHLGMATLAKGLVPLALAIPFAWFLRKWFRQWWISVAAWAIIALPWYVAVYAQNGYPFLEEFFIRHHFERLYSASLQHVQPWYYYIPVLLAGLFPWTPLAGVLASRGVPWDRRRRFLLAVFGFGFLLFSLSLNKLPGYLMPILPSLFAVIGARYEHQQPAEPSRRRAFACALLIALIPLVGSILPASLANGRLMLSGLDGLNRTALFYVLVPVAVVFLSRRSWTGPLLILCIVAGGIYLKAVAYPILDRQASARGLWRTIKGHSGELCDGGTNRDWIYGLSFYQGSLIPECADRDLPYHIRSSGHDRPILSEK
jgi:4-amino-4-deoxy-L-arabinose transferase-like glycosyltransferase